MKSYAQSKEDIFVLNYFGDYKGTLLSIGENDGTTYSNAMLLIENGWRAKLFEPGITFSVLRELHKSNENVHVYNLGVGNKQKTVKFWESGSHVPGGTDIGLVSTTNFEETKRWPQVEFVEKEISVVNLSEFFNEPITFDFISIDCEGSELLALQQIDLEAVGCKALCIEWNGNNELGEKFANYCKGYQVGFISGENLIFCK